MNKEKIALGNSTELSYDSICVSNGCLIISFIGGDMANLEQAFRTAGQTNLEEIRQLDADGNEQAVHERYDIFKAVNKQIAKEAADDIVDIVLEQESDVAMQIRHLQEVTDTLLMEQLSSM